MKKLSLFIYLVLYNIETSMPKPMYESMQDYTIPTRCERTCPKNSVPTLYIYFDSQWRHPCHEMNVLTALQN